VGRRQPPDPVKERRIAMVDEAIEEEVPHRGRIRLA
jgi:hypothetical protein